MTKYREILRLKRLGLSQQSIADSCNVSKKTVNRVLKRAKELNISWPLDKSDTDAVLAEIFFPSAKQVRSNKWMPDLLIDLEVARTDGNYKKVMAKYANPVVLILDEWLLLKPTESEQRDIFELLHRRRKKSSTIFCSQYEFEEWYDQLGGDDSPLADAIIDRIAHDSYRINITSIDAEHDISMREVYGLDKTLRE